MKISLIVSILFFFFPEFSIAKKSEYKKKLPAAPRNSMMQMQNDILEQCNKNYKKKALAHSIKYLKKLEMAGLEPFTVYNFSKIHNTNKDLAYVTCGAQKRGVAARGGKPDCEMACEFSRESTSIVMTIGYYESKDDLYKNLLIGFKYYPH